MPSQLTVNHNSSHSKVSKTARVQTGQNLDTMRVCSTPLATGSKIEHAQEETESHQPQKTEERDDYRYCRRASVSHRTTLRKLGSSEVQRPRLLSWIWNSE